MSETSAAHYKAILKDVAATLDADIDSEIVQHVGTMRLIREGLLARTLRNERVDPDDMLKIDAALKAYLPQGKPSTIELRIVDGTHTVCTKCGNIEEVSAEKLTARMKGANGEKVELAKPAAADSAAPAAPVQAEPAKLAEPVPPPVQYMEGVSASDFHSQVLNGRERAPLKKLERGYGPRSVVSPLSVDPGTAAPRRHNAPPQGSAFLNPRPTRKDN